MKKGAFKEIGALLKLKKRRTSKIPCLIASAIVG